MKLINNCFFFNCFFSEENSYGTPSYPPLPWYPTLRLHCGLIAVDKQAHKCSQVFSISLVRQPCTTTPSPFPYRGENGYLLKTLRTLKILIAQEISRPISHFRRSQSSFSQQITWSITGVTLLNNPFIILCGFLLISGFFFQCKFFDFVLEISDVVFHFYGFPLSPRISFSTDEFNSQLR